MTHPKKIRKKVRSRERKAGDFETRKKKKERSASKE